MKDYKGKRALALLLALAVLLCSFPVVFAEEETGDLVPEEVTVEAQEAPVEVTEPEPAAEPEPEPVVVAEPEPEPVVEPEPEPIVIEVEPDPTPEFVEIPEPKAETPDTDEDEDLDEDFEDEDFDEEEELFEFDEDDAGSISEELLSQFNNPETYEMVEFSGTADIDLKNDEIYFDQDVTLVARVQGVEMSYRLVWEANDGDDRGWYTISSGPEYTFTVTPEIVEREYRVVLFAVD